MKTIVALFLLLGVLTSGAQPVATVPKNIRAANTLENLFDASGLTTSDNLYGIPLEPGGVKGTSYLNPGWSRTTLLLYDAEKMIEGYPARYEIDQDRFEIKSANGVKVLNGRRVKSFVWIDSVTQTPHYFVNAKDFKSDDKTDLSGFFHVLTEGNMTLLSKTSVMVKDPTYNDKFDMGDRDTRIIKKTKYYYLAQNTLREVSSSRKKFFPIFGQHAGDIEQFVKVNKLSLNDAGHLTTIFLRYNGLSVSN